MSRSLQPLSTAIHLATKGLELDVRPQRLYRGSFFTILYCPALDIAKDDIVDTTGAGDAFIGGFIFAFLRNYSVEVWALLACQHYNMCSMCMQDCLQIATFVAREKLMRLGPRAGLPSLNKIRDILQ